MMNGRRRPIENLHRSLSEPSTGENRKPIIGEMAQTSTTCSRPIPYISSNGEMTDVATEYTISMPIIENDNLLNSHVVFLLQKQKCSINRGTYANK